MLSAIPTFMAALLPLTAATIRRAVGPVNRCFGPGRFRQDRRNNFPHLARMVKTRLSHLTEHPMLPTALTNSRVRFGSTEILLWTEETACHSQCDDVLFMYKSRGYIEAYDKIKCDFGPF